MIQPDHRTILILLFKILPLLGLYACSRGGLTPWNHLKPSKSHQHNTDTVSETPSIGVFHGNAEKSSEKSTIHGDSETKPTRENLNHCQEPDYFTSHLYPVIAESTCVRCHHADHESLDLKGEVAKVCDSMIKRANFETPRDSVILLKPLESGVSHGGGTVLSEENPLYIQILKWIDKERGVGSSTDETLMPQKMKLLSNLEYRQSVRALLNAPFEVDLENDRGKIFSNQIQSFSLTRAEKYLDAAIKISQDISPESLDGYPCTPNNDLTCLAGIIENYASKAWRRPLNENEKTRFHAYLSQQIESLQPDELIREAISIIIGSPKFYTRTEAGNSTSQVSQLNDYEIASFLSYTLNKGSPDAELMALASSGQLTSYQTVRQVVQKRLGTTEDNVIYNEFINSLFGLFQIEYLSKSPQNTSFTKEFKTSIAEEIKIVFRKIIQNDKNVVYDFWNTNLTIDDPLLNTHYETSPSKFSGFREIKSPSFHGLLSRAAFMSINAESDHGNPLKRGARLLDHFLCREFPPPPPEANEALESGMNSREFRTANPTCMSCHVEIDPIGYSMESYSEVGKILSNMTVKEESFSLDNNIITFSGLSGKSGLSEFVGKSFEANQCFIRRWYEFMSGSPVSTGQEFILIKKYTEKLMSENSFQEVLTDMIAEYALSNRSSLGGKPDDF